MVLVAFLIIFLAFYIPSFAEKQWMMHPEETWDKEWKKGIWSYLDETPSERARIAIIGGSLIPAYGNNHSHASVLDVGCGEGSLFDFLPENYKSNYLGIDLSKEAIAYAQKKRGNSSNLSSIQVYQPQFQQSAAHLFTLPNPTTKYDVIVFSDVLYYVEYKKILPQYVQYLVNTNGVIIISIFHIKKEQLLYEEIFQFARNSMEYIDEIDLSGLSSYAKKKPRKYTGWHMEIYRKN
jgi:2-polyprenyl-6-hydroxyphenyl methylase/3-demethylubiquinone-9 3-methyltransferase